MLNGVNAETLCELRAVNTLYLSETDHDALEHLIPAGNLFGHFNGQLSVVKCGIVIAELRFVCKTNPFAVDMKCGVRIQPKAEIVAVCPIVQIMAAFAARKGEVGYFITLVAKVTEQVEAGIFHISNGIFVGKLD